uniref:Protein max n=2 Tax=Triatominae TaxID=70999 RepID=A0A0V0G9G0_TRIDM
MRSDDDQDDAEKRAHHNALERKRRDHIKDSFYKLRDSVPTLRGEKSASRAQVLKRAADYIQYMKSKTTSHLRDIDDLRRQNSLLEAQIRRLEKTRVGNLTLKDYSEDISVRDSQESDSSYSESEMVEGMHQVYSN